MIRPLTLVTLIAAAGAGLHVYSSKHEVALLDRELRHIAKSIEEAETRTQALQAEWAWLTEQERLRGLAQRYLALEPMQPAQFARMAEAERRLPPVTAYNGPTALFAARESLAPPGTTVISLLDPKPVAPQAPVAVAQSEPAPTAAPASQPAPAVAEAPPAAPAVTAPALVAAAAVPAPPPAHVPAPAARAPAAEPRLAAARPAEPRVTEPRPALAEIARAVPPPRPAPHPAPRPSTAVASLPPVAVPVRPAVTRVAAAPGAPRVTEAAIPLGSALGSALGGGRPLLPPPVAFAPAANAATLGNAGLR
jgi:hypothetical protein